MPDDVEQLVREVTEVTGAPLPAVVEGDAPVFREDAAARASDEGFYLVGLIGGKEVGKTALVNAIVGHKLAEPTSFGPGTETVVAYAHAKQAEGVARLLEREVPGRYRIVTHEVPRLFHQVLLDLPDVDSHYASHLEVTRRMLRHMLYPVWIQSVEKYADLQPQRLLAAVAAGNDPANFIFCLNKIDQVVAAEGEAAAAELRQDFAKRIARTLALDGQPPRVCMISAIHPDRYDLPQLRDTLTQQKTQQAVRHSLDLAERARGRTLLAWLDDQDLPTRAERLRRLQIEAEELTSQRLGVPLLESAIPRLLDDPAHRLSTTDDVMVRRVARWPIVNVAHALLWPITAIWRRNVTATPGGRVAQPAAEALVDAYLDAGDRPLAQLVRTTFALLHQSHPAVAHLYRDRKLWEDLPADEAAADLRQTLTAAVERQRAAAVSRLAGKGGVIRPLFRVLLTIGALLWFPFVQPVLETIALNDWQYAIPKLGVLAVQLFGVTYLLKNVTFLLLWFGILWLLIRWDTQRKVNRLLARWRTADAADPSLNLASAALEWLDQMLDPIRRARERAEGLVKRTDELRASLTRAAA
jgi:hypothetical protein